MKEFLDITIPLVTFVLMFMVGVDVTIRDFAEAIKRPIGLVVGMVVQFVTLPAIAIVLTLVLDLPVHIQAGLLLLAACPAGGISNYYCVLARSNIAISIVLTVGTCIFTVITMPAAMWFYEVILGQAMNISVPVNQLFIQLIIMVFIPILLGMGLRHYRPEFVAQNKRNLSLIGIIALTGLVGFIVAQQPGEIMAAMASSIVPTIAFTIGAMMVGIITGKVCRVDMPTQFTFAIEFSVRNIAIAAAIAITLLGQVEFAIFAAAYFLIQLPIILIAVVLYRTFAGKISARSLEERI